MKAAGTLSIGIGRVAGFLIPGSKNGDLVTSRLPILKNGPSGSVLNYPVRRPIGDFRPGPVTVTGRFIDLYV